MREVLAKMPYGTAVESVAVVRAVQDSFRSIELHADARAGELLDGGTDVIQQRLDLAPVDVAADGIVKDRPEQLLVLVTHGVACTTGSTPAPVARYCDARNACPAVDYT
jgi:hypothetical protein